MQKQIDLNFPAEIRRRDRLIGLLLTGVLALNYPLLRLFSHSTLLFGIPILYLYLFALWIGFIIGLGLILESDPPPENPMTNNPPPENMP